MKCAESTGSAEKVHAIQQAQALGYMISMYFLYFFLLLFKYKIKKQYTKNTGKKVQEIHADMKCRTNTGLARLYFFMEKYIFILKSAGIAGNEFYQRNAAIPLLITFLLNEPP